MTTTAVGRGLPEGWWHPLPLMALVLVPAAAGTLRVVEVTGGPAVVPTNPRVVGSAVPLVVHIVSGVGFGLLGAIQLPRGVRRRWPRWHRVVGRALVGAGLAAATSAVWLTAVSAAAGATHPLLVVLRVTAGSAMGASLTLGLGAVRRRDIRAHRAWMLRAYALGLGAGTQTITIGVGQAVLGPGDLAEAWMHGLGWALNLLVAEVAILRGRHRAGTGRNGPVR